ncbi:transcriptional regulator [Lasius niger]|uniref:Transcriptional regulator n=1 Tax=Lasius niger TaxID=67767 RepID=A0A0J7JTD6_LASNI|nr:transcriptional regulator [Lasius niger]
MDEAVDAELKSLGLTEGEDIERFFLGDKARKVVMDEAVFLRSIDSDPLAAADRLEKLQEAQSSYKGENFNLKSGWSNLTNAKGFKGNLTVACSHGNGIYRQPDSV